MSVIKKVAYLVLIIAIVFALFMGYGLHVLFLKSIPDTSAVHLIVTVIFTFICGALLATPIVIRKRKNQGSWKIKKLNVVFLISGLIIYCIPVFQYYFLKIPLNYMAITDWLFGWKYTLFYLWGVILGFLFLNCFSKETI